MKPQPKDDYSEHAGELSRITTDNRGTHAQLIIG